MTEKRFRISQGYSDKFCHDWEENKLLNFKQTIDYLNTFYEENEQLKTLIKKTLETTPIEHTLAVELKNSVRELYD